MLLIDDHVSLRESESRTVVLSDRIIYVLAISYLIAATIFIAVVIPNVNKLMNVGTVLAEIIEVDTFEYLSVWGGYDTGYELTLEYSDKKNIIKIYRTERERLAISSFSKGDKFSAYLNEDNELAFADRLLEFCAFRVLIMAILNIFLVGLVVTKLSSTNKWIWILLVISSGMSLFAFLSYAYLWIDRDYKSYMFLFGLCIIAIIITLLLSVFKLYITEESLKENTKK